MRRYLAGPRGKPAAVHSSAAIQRQAKLRVELDEQLMSANCRPRGPTELGADSRHCDALSSA